MDDTHEDVDENGIDGKWHRRKLHRRQMASTWTTTKMAPTANDTDVQHRRANGIDNTHEDDENGIDGKWHRRQWHASTANGTH
jgi:hypothetical protein